MALIEAEEELFGLGNPQVSVDLNELSGSEEEYDDDDARDHTTGQQPSGAQVDQGDAHDAAADPDAAKVVKPKRVIKNPQPKLDVARLCGPRGIGIIQKFLSDAPYRGKGYETEDLGLLLKKLQHWAHRLYPKLPFLDTIINIEKLGTKKPLQVNMKRLRLDMYETPKEGTVDGEVVDVAERPDGGVDDAPPDDEQPDVFDELLRQSGTGLHERLAAGGRIAAAVGPPPPSLPPSQPIVLTDEQKARIERNKQLALARRQAMLAAAASSSSAPTPAVSVPAERSSNSQEQQKGISNKRSREEGADRTERDDDGESVQPTPAELRSLREALFSGVVSSQNNLVTVEGNAVIENLSLVANKKHDFEDDFEEMDVDDVLPALNTVECQTEIAATAVPTADDDDGRLIGATVINSSHESVLNTDCDQSNEESSADLPGITPSSTVETQPEENSGLDESKSVKRDDQETNFSGDVSDDLKSAVDGQANLRRENISEKQVQDADEEDVGEHETDESPNCQATENDSPEKVAVEDEDHVGSSKLMEESAHSASDLVTEISFGDAINSLEEQESESEGLEMEATNISR